MVAVALVAGTVAATAGWVPSAAAQPGGFVDVTGGVHKPNIDALDARGVIAGTECAEAMFCPSQAIKRSTVAVWLVRAVDDDEPAAISESRFADVGAEWWMPYAERLAELQITAGCRAEPLSFCPDQAVTRAQMATFLARAFDLQAAQSAGFADTKGNTHEASIDALAAAGVTAGCSAEPLSFCPGQPVTRAQMATFLARALDDEPSPPTFRWSLPSHCPGWMPVDPHTDPGGGCPVWWSHLLDLEPTPEGITADDMRRRLAAALPNYASGAADSLDRLSGRAREVIANTVTELAAADPLTAERIETITAHLDGCGGYSHAAACAWRNGINFVAAIAQGSGLWLADVYTVAHEWAHLRDFRVAPGGGYAAQWCEQMAERASADEASERLVTHMALLEAASAAHDAPLVSGPGCAGALIARFAPEIASHDQPGQILELSANAQAQVWMRRGHASAEARWWAAETAAGYPPQHPPLDPPLELGPLMEAPEPGGCDDFNDRDPELCVPDDCHDGMHEHPYRPNTRHYHRGGLQPHTHHRWHILVDGIAVPTDAARPAGAYCEYPDGRRVISSWSAGQRLGEPVTVDYAVFSPDGLWSMEGYSICIDITDPEHPRHDPDATNADSVAAHQVCDGTSDHLWKPCDASGRCPTESNFDDGEYDDGEYDGGWVTCGEAGLMGYYWDICRQTTGQPRAN